MPPVRQILYRNRNKNYSKNQSSLLKGDLTLPGTNFVGPQSQLNNLSGTRNSSDNIALHHDYAYNVARSQGDIRNADWHSAKRFGLNYLRTGEWQSAVGALGLAGKTGIERLTGKSLYSGSNNLGEA